MGRGDRKGWCPHLCWGPRGNIFSFTSHRQVSNLRPREAISQRSPQASLVKASSHLKVCTCSSESKLGFLEPLRSAAVLSPPVKWVPLTFTPYWLCWVRDLQLESSECVWPFPCRFLHFCFLFSNYLQLILLIILLKAGVQHPYVMLLFFLWCA